MNCAATFARTHHHLRSLSEFLEDFGRYFFELAFDTHGGHRPLMSAPDADHKTYRAFAGLFDEIFPALWTAGPHNGMPKSDASSRSLLDCGDRNVPTALVLGIGYYWKDDDRTFVFDDPHNSLKLVPLNNGTPLKSGHAPPISEV
jgi:hypothetical protein